VTLRPYAAVILAGGLSSRMNRFKPLLSLGNGTIADHVIETFRHNNVDVILVGGYRSEELFARVTTRDVIFKENPDYKTGMFSSVRAGVSALSREYRGFFVIPVDIPLVRPATIDILLQKAAQHLHSIIYPVFRGRRGHPPLIPAELAKEITDFKDGEVLRAVLSLHDADVVNVPVADSGILLDIDTPADYEEVMRRFSTRHIPKDEECDAIFELNGTKNDRIIHGMVTSRVAGIIGQALVDAGQEVDIELVKSAALLHDIAKGQSRHDETGGSILRRMGFDKVSDIVGIHTDLGGGPVDTAPLIARVVYLADKYVRGDKIMYHLKSGTGYPGNNMVKTRI
jgi:CTP:molybdopterin cytidylyltransferase MocA